VGSFSVLVLGVMALVVVVAGVAMVVVLARKQASVEQAPESQPGDYVAPVSSGGFTFRKTDESAEQFKERVARENEAASSTKR
jgi:hypothetical protein